MIQPFSTQQQLKEKLRALLKEDALSPQQKELFEEMKLYARTHMREIFRDNTIHKNANSMVG